MYELTANDRADLASLSDPFLAPVHAALLGGWFDQARILIAIADDVESSS